MGNDGGKGRVEHAEEQRSFQNNGQEPQGPKKGSKNFSKYCILKMQRFSKLLSDAVVIGMFLAYFGEKM